MEYYSSHINKLIEQFSHLPGIGAKSAQRLAFHIMNMPKEQVQQLTNAITDARMNVQYCKCCYTLTDKEMCPICSNPKRDHSTIMVVENTRDLAAYEKTGKFDGVYHVLHGAISPGTSTQSQLIFNITGECDIYHLSFPKLHGKTKRYVAIIFMNERTWVICDKEKVTGTNLYKWFVEAGIQFDPCFKDKLIKEALFDYFARKLQMLEV